jgi:inner membrane protein
VPLNPDHGTLDFTLDLEVNGSGTLALTPVGARTTAVLTSSWPNPSFGGNALPREHTIGNDGFSAEWSLLSLNRRLPRRWLSTEPELAEPLLGALHDGAFGVELRFPVDAYQKVLRAVKYAALFALVTFVGFFAVEHGGRLSIHPVQYIVVAFGLCVFYALLLSLSELIAFGLAFLVASAALVLMVCGYLRAALGRRGLAAAAVLAGVYGALYVMLQLEELALLLGSLVLLGVLGTLMLLTRRVNIAAASEPPAAPAL